MAEQVWICHRGCMHEGGGTEAVQAQWWAAAFNYLTIPEFLRVVFAAPWENPGCVAVTIKNEHEDRPTLYLPPTADAGTPP